MKQQIVLKDRTKLEAKMASVFGDKLKGLSPELQEILLDDMMTAFENRLNVLNRAQRKSQLLNSIDEEKHLVVIHKSFI